MEKRTILALVLSFLVLFVWSYLFTPQKNQPGQLETPAERPVSPEQAPLPKSDAVSSEPLEESSPEAQSEVVQTISEKEIEIQTPLYTAVFSNVGPTIKSFELKKYRETIEPDSPLIQMVTLKDQSADFFLMNFKPNSSGQDRKTVYQADQEAISLKPGASAQDLVFRAVNPEGLVITQIFRFYPDRYNIAVNLTVANPNERPVEGVCTAELEVFPPEGKKSYYSYIGLALLLNDQLEEVKLKKVSEPKQMSGKIDWMAYENEYFISAIAPDNTSQGSFHGRLFSSGLLKGLYSTPPFAVGPSQKVSSSFTLYLGPRDLKILKKTGKKLDKAIDFGWFDIIAKGLLFVLLFCNKFVNNYGISIILLTVLIKIIFWPLTHKSYKSMKEMQKIQPIMAKIREKYKNDRQQMNIEMMNLYKTYKVNPLGGCLPMLVQLPVFFALYRLLGASIELRHAPFMLWIKDLSAPDRLFPFTSPSIPLMSPPYGIPVLTLLMGASMFVQQKMTPTPGDPAQAKVMMLMPVIFTFMFINFPSGLVLYWLVNNILSIGQQYRILKKSA